MKKIIINYDSKISIWFVKSAYIDFSSVGIIKRITFPLILVTPIMGAGILQIILYWLFVGLLFQWYLYFGKGIYDELGPNFNFN